MADRATHIRIRREKYEERKNPGFTLWHQVAGPREQPYILIGWRRPDVSPAMVAVKLTIKEKQRS